MNKTEDLSIEYIVQVLNSMGAFDVRHTGRTLGDHLLNTMELMLEIKCPLAACYAGALHSIYGTNVFRNGVIGHEHRENVKNAIGEEVENLVYLFSVANRPKEIEEGIIRNRFNGEFITSDLETIGRLRLMEAANLMEQGCSILRYPEIHKAWIDRKNATNFATKW